jgi:hypothetical protein
MYKVTLTKYGLGFILGNFLGNFFEKSSGHPGARRKCPSKPSEAIFLIFSISAVN